MSVESSYMCIEYTSGDITTEARYSWWRMVNIWQICVIVHSVSYVANGCKVGVV